MDAGFRSWFLQLTYIAPSMFYDIPSRDQTFSPIKWRKSSPDSSVWFLKEKFLYNSPNKNNLSLCRLIDLRIYVVLRTGIRK